MHQHKLSIDNHNGSEQVLPISHSCDSTTELSSVQHFNDDIGDLGRPVELGLAHHSIPDSMGEVAGTNNNNMLSFFDKDIDQKLCLRTKQYPSISMPKPSDFALPESLQTILLNGLSQSYAQHSIENAAVLADIIITEAEKCALEKKKEARARLKRNHPSLQKSVPVQQRSVYRSRIEAQVSRVKGEELNRVLKSTIRWIIENTHGQLSSDCPCGERNVKRRKTVS